MHELICGTAALHGYTNAKNVTYTIHAWLADVALLARKIGSGL